jgi:protein O-mannosyl-transferase
MEHRERQILGESQESQREALVASAPGGSQDASGASGDGRGNEPSWGEEVPQAAADAQGGQLLPRHWQMLLVAVGLGLAVWLVFGQTRRFTLTNFDDNHYVLAKPVADGLSRAGIVWALTESAANNWHPLTWLSHMLDWQMFRDNFGGHHVTSVVLHAATAVLLFWFMLALARAARPQQADLLWPCAVAAAVFAVHPLRAESVAWVSERKDVLSGVLFLATLLAYVRYARLPFAWRRYLAVVGLYAAGLMAKPMLVSVPALLVLLDWWPLGRIVVSGQWSVVSGEDTGGASGTQGGGWWRRRVVLEKVPLVCLALASCIITLAAQHKTLQQYTVDVSWPWRLANAVLACGMYLVNSLWPQGLVPLYPHPGANISLVSVLAAAAGLVTITVAVVHWRKKWPWLTVAWLWYLIMLLPVLGIVQVGKQGMADRYTYLPQMGLAMALAWAMAAAGRAWPQQRGAWTAIALAALAALMMMAWRQTSHWRNSETLWEYTIGQCPRNAVAHGNLGEAMMARGNLSGALVHLRRATELDPQWPEMHYSLAQGMIAVRDSDGALEQLHTAVKLRADYPAAWYDLGRLLVQRDQVAEAIAAFKQALRGHDEFAAAHFSLGGALMRAGHRKEAAEHWHAALRLHPNDADARKAVEEALRSH